VLPRMLHIRPAAARARSICVGWRCSLREGSSPSCRLHPHYPVAAHWSRIRTEDYVVPACVFRRHEHDGRTVEATAVSQMPIHAEIERSSELTPNASPA
jgi:hypothetical protein